MHNESLNHALRVLLHSVEWFLVFQSNSNNYMVSSNYF